MLTRSEILRHIRETNQIVIDPFEESHVGPNSVDLRLSNELKVYGTPETVKGLLNPAINTYEGNEYLQILPRVYDMVLDMKRDNPTQTIMIPEEGLILLPDQLYLGATLEYTETRGFVPTIETRSSVARLGKQSHLSAGYGDTNFCGQWVLEIIVIHPLRVYPGARICQIAYSPIVGREASYSGKYSGQRGPVASRMWKDFIK